MTIDKTLPTYLFYPVAIVYTYHHKALNLCITMAAHLMSCVVRIMYYMAIHLNDVMIGHRPCWSIAKSLNYELLDVNLYYLCMHPIQCSKR